MYGSPRTLFLKQSRTCQCVGYLRKILHYYYFRLLQTKFEFQWLEILNKSTNKFNCAMNTLLPTSNPTYAEKNLYIHRMNYFWNLRNPIRNYSLFHTEQTLVEFRFTLRKCNSIFEHCHCLHFFISWNLICPLFSAFNQQRNKSSENIRSDANSRLTVF